MGGECYWGMLRAYGCDRRSHSTTFGRMRKSYLKDRKGQFQTVKFPQWKNASYYEELLAIVEWKKQD